jgi:hypothetical protein
MTFEHHLKKFQFGTLPEVLNPKDPKRHLSTTKKNSCSELCLPEVKSPKDPK